MKCKELLVSALKHLGEVGDETNNPDYAERAPYIIAAFVGEAGEIDRRYRIAHGLEEKAETDRVFIPLDEEFPLTRRLVSPCVFYLASLLIADESPELSECYYDRYCDSISTISATLPSKVESIIEIY